MRAFAIVLCCSLLGSPAAAQKPNLFGATEEQVVAMTNIMVVSLLEIACPKWRVSDPAFSALLIRNNLKIKDLSVGGKFEQHMRTASSWAEEKIKGVKPEDRCATAEKGFGPEGVVERDLMVKR